MRCKEGSFSGEKEFHSIYHRGRNPSPSHRYAAGPALSRWERVSHHPHIFFFSGSRSGYTASRFWALAANASAIWGPENMPVCQVAM